MIVIKIMAGLGNQMFQYALYKNLVTQGKNVSLDISFFDYFQAHNGYELERVFNIKPSYATLEESNRLGDTRLDIKRRLLRKIGFKKDTHYVQDIVYGFGFNQEVLDIKQDFYLQGYWQSEKYFSGAKDKIRDDFAFKNILDDKNLHILDEIKNSMSVSIHIRRGDYVKSSNLGGVCTLDYYRKSIDYIVSIVKDAIFFVFSDDVAWCKENLNGCNFVYVEGNSGLNSYKDMQLMSMCKHNIIANSSFSWWAAWLNNYPRKIVIAPSKWFANEKTVTNDIIPNEWVIIRV